MCNLTKLVRRKIKNKNILLNKLNPLLLQLYAKRGIQNLYELNLNIKNLIPFNSLKNILNMVDILYKAIYKEKNITIFGDFDTDGATSIALVVLTLKEMGVKNVSYIMPNRFKNGFGLSNKIIDKAKKIGTEILITVDTGISSFSEIEYAKKNNIQVLITDHHLPTYNCIPNAKSIINPNLEKNSLLSSMSGVGISFYLMLALFTHLKNKKWFQKNKLLIPNPFKFLDLVVIGTVSDLVPFDQNNRILVWQGLKKIRNGKCRVGIIALLDFIKFDKCNLSCSDINFFITPILNSAGRLDDMSISVELLLTDDINQAKILIKKLDILNKNRKKISKNMYDQANLLCKKIEKKEFIYSIILYHKEWHQGITGIIASRLKEQFYRPVIIFAYIGDGILKGSGRSIPEINIYNILKNILTLYPNLILTFGGHSMAIGLSIKEENFNKFSKIFIKIISKNIKFNNIKKIILSDGSLSKNEINISTAELLSKNGPWGPNFLEPIFDNEFFILKKQLIKKKYIKVLLKPFCGGELVEGFAFNINWLSFLNLKKAKLAYKLNINKFQNKRKLQIIIQDFWKN